MHRPLAHIFVVLAACGGGTTPPPAPVANTGRPLPPHVDAVCPDSVLGNAWSAELFPGCPPEPFWRVGAVCSGECPKPCSATIDDPGRYHRITMQFVYDEQGRLSGTHYPEVGTRGDYKYAPKRPAGRATFCKRDARRGHCAAQDHEEEEVDAEHADVEVGYDEEGNVVSFLLVGDRDDATRFTYLPGRRLAVEIQGSRGEFKRRFDYSYDDRGWLVKIASSGTGFDDTRTYVHDELGRLASITTVHDRTRSVQRFEYDARGRLVRMIEDATHPTLEPRHEESVYRYECAAPRPFEEAIPIAEALSKRACACADAACKTRVRGEYKEFLYSADGVIYAEGTSRDQYDRFEKHSSAVDQCLR